MNEQGAHVQALQDAMRQFWELQALVVAARELLLKSDEDKQNAAHGLLDMAERLAGEYAGEAWEAWEPSGDAAPGSVRPAQIKQKGKEDERRRARSVG